MSKKKIFLLLFVVFSIGIISYLIYYANDYYKADQISLDIISSEKETKDYFYFEGNNTTNNTGIIIYPGGKVDEKAYSTMAKSFSLEGIPTFILKMPFHLSILSNNKANSVINDFQNINNWIVIGHSLGGTSASIFTNENNAKIKGIVFLASYPYKDLSGLNIEALSFVCENDKVLNLENYEKSKAFFPKGTKFIDIKGGNHANFGNYGFQKGDGVATISGEEQQKIVISDILSFIKDLK